VFSIFEIDKLIGLQRWVSTTSSIFIPSVAYFMCPVFLYHMTRGSSPLDSRAAESVLFYARSSPLGMGNARYQLGTRLYSVSSSLFALAIPLMTAVATAAYLSLLAPAVSLCTTTPGTPWCALVLFKADSSKLAHQDGSTTPST